MLLSLIFFGLAAALASLVTLDAGPARWLALWPAAGFALLAMGYAGLGPGIFGKTADGRLPAWSRLIHGPIFILNHVLWHTERIVGGENAADEVSPGVFVGRRPRLRDLPSGVARVVDLTAEFTALRGGPAVIVLPTLDATAPSPSALERIAALAAEAPGPILFHCASGHGRSAAAAAAYLMVLGRFSDHAEAEAAMKRARPSIVLNRPQRRALAAWWSGRAGL